MCGTFERRVDEAVVHGGASNDMLSAHAVVFSVEDRAFGIG